ncbi:MAG TPA: LysR family transcriptional regulator [Verrucomicrobiales bacterium]|nr:LysR family transcriptional regulator [Verrucomicrobiales bacterium]HBU58853.1 LysR family transcriptional regulator [Verrucomicrobiales bacterium]|tara:strand:- start:890 stop:1759 length:870 start_codon:yes stop_codon:yes gene_type:complete
MNIHHLELFYYVAKHKGIAGAVRNMPYGIQQPAVSAQVIQLENDLGITLFQRRPFELTPAGKELYAFTQPFFENLDAISQKIRGGVAQTIRIAASTTVFRDHLPDILSAARKEYQSLHPSLRVGIQPEIEKWLLENEVDLGVTVLSSKPPSELKSEKLLELPMVLMVPTRLKAKTVEEILGQDRIAQTLISLPQNEGITRAFQSELSARKIDWPLGIELNSVDLISTYAASGFGIGLSLALPGKKAPKGIRVLPLKDFPGVPIGALWRGQLSPVGQRIVDLLKEYATTL